jgi:hypothetical protein
MYYCTPFWTLPLPVQGRPPWVLDLYLSQATRDERVRKCLRWLGQQVCGMLTLVVMIPIPPQAPTRWHLSPCVRRRRRRRSEKAFDIGKIGIVTSCFPGAHDVLLSSPRPLAALGQKRLALCYRVPPQLRHRNAWLSSSSHS